MTATLDRWYDAGFKRILMLRRALSSLIVIACLSLVACGGSPTAPTPSANVVSDVTAEAAASAMVMQALSQTAASEVTLASSLPLSPVTSYQCPGGGNITTTTTMPALTAGVAQQGAFTLTSRTEYNDCRSQNVIMRGAPALEHTSEIRTSGGSSGASTVLTATMRMTGGLSATSNGVESVMRVDCTSVMVIELGQLGSMPVPQVTWTGTMTWESPAGIVVRTSGCGPSR